MAKIICSRCQSENVVVRLEQTEAKTKNKKRGCLTMLGRWTLILCTFGLWFLVPKFKGKSNTKFKSQTVAICQSCGNTWQVK